MTEYQSGWITSDIHSQGVRAYYEAMLLETLRSNSIFVPYLRRKTDFAARSAGQIIYSEVFDTDPNWEPGSETGIWMEGRHLDSRQVSIPLEIHGDSIKHSDYTELVNFWNNGDFRGLVRGKLGQNMVDYLDYMARQALLAAPSAYITYGGDATSRATLVAGDLLDVGLVSLARLHLEERDVPGVKPPDGQSRVVVCLASPRQIYDIKSNVPETGSNRWINAQEYAGSVRLFNGEVGLWDNIRFVKSNRLRLRNYGVNEAQTTLDGATVEGQGAAATVDSVYSVGQSGSTRTVPVVDASVFSVGDVVTIHEGSSGDPVVESDGTQETRRVVALETTTDEYIVFDKPLLKAHASGDLVTKGVDLHAAIVLGGPSCVWGIAELPHVLRPPKIDDLMMVNRLSWRHIGAMRQFRPEFQETILTGGTVN
jgi:N4-gp56 family major capsid protein